MHALLRILMMIALAVVTVSTAPHAHAGQQPEAHAAHSGHTHHGARHEHENDSGHDPTTCCPTLSVHCGAAAVLCEETWSPVERLTLAVSQARQDRAELVATFPEFEPPPPRS